MTSDTDARSTHLQTLFLRVEKLKSDNWNDWKSVITSLLEMNALDAYIASDAAPPPPDDPAAPTEDEKNAVTKWRTEDKLCFGLIKISVSADERVHTTGTDTSAALWKSLCDVKEPKGMLGALAARRRLFRLVAEEGTSMADHITTFRKLQNECTKMNVSVPDADLALLLITSLSDSWDSFIASFFGSNYAASKTTISLSTLITTLCEEDERRRTKANATESAQRAVGKSSRPKPICTNCKKSGHSKENCYAKGGGKEGQAPWNKKKDVKKEDVRPADSANVASELPDVAYISASKSNSQSPRDEWISDSAASSHICNNRGIFVTFRADNFEVGGVGQSNSTPALGRGTVQLLSTIQGHTRTITLRDVIYCPEAVHNLMSISKLDAIGGYALYKGGEVTHYTADGSILATGSLHGKLYHLNMQGKPPPGEMANLAKHKRPLTLDEWHRAYGHISIRAIQDLERKGMVTGLRIDANSKPSLTCVACIQGKAKHTPIPKFSSGGNHKKGDLTHSDLWGPARIKSLQQSLYYISFIDDATRLIRVRFLKDKSQAKVELQNYLTWVHTQLDRMPKTIRVDNGSEYINQELRAWCAERGIEITTNAPYSHAQHGNAERPNRTLMELARAMLIEKHLPLFLWQEAVRYAAYVRERAPTRALDSRTPYEMWNGKKPDVSHLREFGCDVWILTEEMKAQSKIEARAQKMVFTGQLKCYITLFFCWITVIS